MKGFPLGLGALGLLALGVAAGCGSPSQTGLNAPNSATRIPAYRSSWVSPDAKNARALLFESDFGYESVEMFSLPDLKLKGVLTGIGGPAGMCSDSSGNVYVVTQYFPFEAVEISHAGKVIRAVSDFYAYPGGCAVNPHNGDLAIANIEGNSQPGMVSIYPGGASGYARWLRCTALSAYYFTGYDAHGDIFVDGVDKSGGFHLCRGRDTKDTLTEVKITGTKINAPGMIAWYSPGKYLAVGDQHCTGSNTSCIYEVSISGNTGRVIGSTKPLNPDGSPVCDLVQGAIAPDGGTMLFGGNNPVSCNGQSPSVDQWPYPAGGVPSKHYGNTNFINEPTGAALSEKTAGPRDARSWMLPEAKHDALLYVNDPKLVRVYTYPKGKLVGTLKQTYFPDGLCADPNTGDVFLTEQSEIVEYAHGGTTPINILSFPGGGAYSCSVDPRSGNLAVTDSGYPAAFYVYPNASGTPQKYGDLPELHTAAYCVYDDRGNLYVTGYTLSDFALDELSNKGALFAVALGATETTPSGSSGAQWDGKALVLSDGAQNLYRFKIVRHNGVLVGQATLDDAESVSGMWLDGNRLIVPNDGPSYNGDVQFYDYPAGGAPVKTMTGFYRPFGSTVSVVPR